MKERKNPKIEPVKIENIRFSGSHRFTRSGVKNTCKAPEIRQPNSTKGNASITIDKKIVLICKTELGIKENMSFLLFFSSSFALQIYAFIQKKQVALSIFTQLLFFIEALQLTFSIIPIKLRSRTYHFYHKRENQNETNH